MNEGMWRFPASGFGLERGLSTGDSETFKGRPYQAFAREILQNSIDARKDNNAPVRVEFKTFTTSVADIPGTEELKSTIRRCYEYWAHKEDHVKVYKNMEMLLKSGMIQCLRVSDFNTKGLIGVESDEQAKNTFLALTKGSGVSEKENDVAGGSKGIGKNATIQMSELRTIFYSTHTCADIKKNPIEHKGHMGVADFVSGYVSDDENVVKRDYTSGPGYFVTDEYNRPSSQLFNIDSDFTLRDAECGTDIYILGFEGDDSWEKEVVNSVLDSFLVAVIRGELEVIVNKFIINRECVESLINNKDLIYKNNYGNLLCQYRMLTGNEMVQVFNIETEYGDCELYILPLPVEEDYLATHKCVMVRHPLMKIKTFDIGASFRVSALCIIGKNSLGKILRDIENAEHNNWQTKRIKDNEQRKEIDSIISLIRREINQNVIECLQMGDMEPLDPNGAGDFLPDIDQGNCAMKKNEGNQTPSENVNVVSIKENNVIEEKASQYNEHGNGLEPFIGSQNEEMEGDVQHPNGHNEGNGGENHPGTNSCGAGSGDEELFRKAQLSGVKYKVISTDKRSGKVRIIFVAPIDYEKCFLQVKLRDDTNNTSKITIKNMTCKGKNVGEMDSDGYGPFQIKRNEKIVLDIETDRKSYFASEVKVVCK